MKYSPLMPMLSDGEVVFVDIQGGKVYKAIVTTELTADGAQALHHVSWKAEDAMAQPIFTEIAAHRETLKPELPEEIVKDTLNTQRQLRGRRPPTMPVDLPPCKNKEN